MVKGKPFLACLAAVLTLAVFQGCEDREVVRYDRNRPPETYLSVAPEVGGRIFHKYRVHWAGLDRDGVVVSYRVAAVAEDEIYGGRVIAADEDIVQYFLDQEQAYLAEGREFWTTTSATESLFVFRADKPNTRNHSLYVAAVDNEGKEDPMPAATNFLAIDYGIPDIEVCITSNLDPDTCAVPSVKGDTLPAYNLVNPGEPVLLTFNWGGTDSDGSIDEWKYRLDSSAESSVGPEVLSAQYTYDPSDPVGSDLGIGFHEFRLVAIDDAGAKSDESITRFVINYDPDTYIDSIWTFRRFQPPPASNLPVPEKLIYPSDSIRVAYHFGCFRLKFHGTDIDGPTPESFRWNIRGTLIQSADPENPSSPWVSNECGDLYCDEFPTNAPRLDTDSPLTFFLRARDNLGKVDGSPDTIVFLVNYSPRITSVSHEVVSPGNVRFTWECVDPDQDVDRPSSPGEQALVLYRYRVDDGDWVPVTQKVNKLYVMNCTVTGLGAGHHTFMVQAYNGVYLLTRSDLEEYDFEL
jgi:hypothetical protein